MDTIRLAAPAKINLWLEVRGRLENGYHEISSVMASVSLCDDVEVRLTNQQDIVLSCPGAGLPEDEGNLAHRAAAAFAARCEAMTGGVEIKISKTIPVAAGLAGGSTDAAATLKALNMLYGEPFSQEELCGIGATLGADIPFCLTGGAAVASGIGERLDPCRRLPDCHIVIAAEKFGVCTAEAYAALDRMSYKPLTIKPMLDALESGNLASICAALHNRFEDMLTDIPESKTIMMAHGALGTLMSGSGPSVFGIFNEKKCAENAVAALRRCGKSAYLTRPL